MINSNAPRYAMPPGLPGGALANLQTPSVSRDGAAAATSTPVAPSATGQPVSTFSSFLSQAFSALSTFLGKVVDWFKGLFGSKPAAEVLSPADQAIATQYGLQASKLNIDAFRAEVGSYQANGTLGPGVQNPDGVKQLQLALARLGYPAAATGAYDQATAQAVLKFKVDTGLHQTYRSADGNFAVNEYATPDVIQGLLARLQAR